MDNWARGGKMLRAGEVCDYDYVLAARSCLVTVMSSLFSLHVCFMYLDPFTMEAVSCQQLLLITSHESPRHIEQNHCGTVASGI